MITQHIDLEQFWIQLKQFHGLIWSIKYKDERGIKLDLIRREKTNIVIIQTTQLKRVTTVKPYCSCLPWHCSCKHSISYQDLVDHKILYLNMMYFETRIASCDYITNTFILNIQKRWQNPMQWSRIMNIYYSCRIMNQTFMSCTTLTPPLRSNPTLWKFIGLLSKSSISSNSGSSAKILFISSPQSNAP